MLVVRRPRENGVEEISRDAAIDLLKRGGTDIWLHFDTPTEEDLHFLQEAFKIHPLTIEDIVNQNQRPKIEPFEDYVYLAIHPLRRKARWTIAPTELDLLLGKAWIVSVHYGALPGLIENSRLHEKLAAGLGRGTDFLIYTFLDLVVDSYFPILDDVEDEVDALEEQLLTRASKVDISGVLRLKRSLVHVRRAVTPQRDVLNQLTHHDSPFVRPETVIYFRDVYDHLIRIADEIDSLRDILSSLLEIHLAAISNQLNITMKRLTAWGIILVTITAIASVYGMNFKFMPELEWRYGYFAALAGMALIASGLYAYFKKRGDL
jgi:magnesium transporter